MRILKKILIILVILLIGGFIYVYLQPNQYDVKRTHFIKAPANLVFEELIDFKNWKKWGPWYETDSSIEASYPELTKGVGGSYSWTSKDGSGSMKTIALVENKSIDQKLKFGDFEPSNVYWKLNETNGGTEVTWGMKADPVPFMLKFFGAISGGMEKMLGPMEEKGLQNLEKVVLNNIKNNPNVLKKYKIGEISEINLPKQQFIGYHLKAKINELPKLFEEYLPKAGMHAAKNNAIPQDYTPGAIYTKWDEEKGLTEFYIGLFTENLNPAPNMQKITIPASKIIKLTKYGNYGEGDQEAHNNIASYMNNKKLKFGQYIWEKYMNDPSKVKPKEIQTDIFYQLK